MQRGRGRQGFGWEALLDGAAAGDGLLTDPRWQPQAGVEHHQRTAGPAISKEAAPAATEPATEAQASKSVPKEGLDALLAYGSDPDEAVEGGKEPVSAAGGGSKGVGAPSPPANANGAPVDHRKVNFAASAAAGRGTRGGRGRGSQSERGRGRGRGANPGRQPWQAPPRPMEPSLLEKLLSKEIRQDRSYLLQAFRFFVLNGFLVNYGNGEPLQFPRSAPAVDEGADGDGRSNKPSVKDILGKKWFQLLFF